MRYITLTSVADSYHASFIEEELAKEGIRCWVVNENAANLLQYAGSIGDCVLIRVLDTDYVMARQVLNKFEAETAAVACPNCNSTKIEYGSGLKNAFKRVLLLFWLLVVASPGRFRLSYRCGDCSHEFRKGNF